MFNQAFLDLKNSYGLTMDRRQLFYKKYGITEFSTTVFYQHMQISETFIEEWGKIYDEYYSDRQRLRKNFELQTEDELSREVSIAGFTLFNLKDNNLDIIIFVDTLGLLPWWSVRKFIKHWSPNQIDTFVKLMREVNPAPGADIGTNFYELFQRFLPFIMSTEECESHVIKPF